MQGSLSSQATATIARLWRVGPLAVACLLLALPAAAQEPARQADSVTEISDEEYRSFCYPCYALEELLDSQRGN